MRLKFGVILCGAVVAAIGAGSLPVHAAEIGTFTVPTSNPEFAYTAATPTSNGELFSTPTASSPIGAITGTFTFNTGPLAGTPLDATFEMNAVTNTPVDTSESPLLSQALVDVFITITGTSSTNDANNGVNASTNLLSVDIANEDGTGSIQGVDGSVTASAAGSQPGDTVEFTSDIIPTLSGYTSQAWDLVLNPVSPALGTNTPSLTQPAVVGVDVVTLPSFLNSFTGVAPDGISFSGTPGGGSGIPEPASLGLLGLGASMLMVRKSRKSTR